MSLRKRVVCVFCGWWTPISIKVGFMAVREPANNLTAFPCWQCRRMPNPSTGRTRTWFMKRKRRRRRPPPPPQHVNSILHHLVLIAMDRHLLINRNVRPPSPWWLLPPLPKNKTDTVKAWWKRWINGAAQRQRRARYQWDRPLARRILDGCILAVTLAPVLVSIVVRSVAVVRGHSAAKIRWPRRHRLNNPAPTTRFIRGWQLQVGTKSPTQC